MNLFKILQFLNISFYQFMKYINNNNNNEIFNQILK